MPNYHLALAACSCMVPGNYLPVIGGIGKPLCAVVITVFEIGQVEIDYSVQQTH